MERLEMHRIRLTEPIRLAGGPDPQRLRRRSGRSAAAAASGRTAGCGRSSDAMELHRIDVHRVVGDRLPRLGEIDDLGQRLLDELGIDAARSRSSILPTGFSGRSVSRGRASSSTTLAGRSVRISSGRIPRCSATSISLRSLSRMRCSRLRIAPSSTPALRRESRRAPASVIPPVAQLPFFGRQRQQRARQPHAAAPRTIASPLRPGPARPGRRPAAAACVAARAAC